MTLSLIARANNSGLCAQSFEVFRNLRPARTLVVIARPERLPLRRDLYRPSKGCAVRFCAITDIDRQLVWLLGGDTSVVYAAETAYSPNVAARAPDRGVRVVIHANPELWTPSDGAGETWAPTHWEIDRLPEGTPVVPFPVATDRLTYRRRERVECLFHLGAPAFHDRAGTQVVLDAVPDLPDGIPLKMRAVRPPRWTQPRVGARVEWLGPVRDYTDAIPDDADLMLQPRRYGGLNLPLQEAAASGLPVVMTDMEPQRAWLTPELLVPATGTNPKSVQMRGGTFLVHDVDPVLYATRVDLLVADPDLVAVISDDVYGWGRSRSWDLMVGEYRERLGLETSTKPPISRD